MSARAVAIKVSTEGRCSLANPQAALGETLLGSVVWRVLEVPPEVTPLEAVELFGSCVIWRPAGPYIVRYSELRPGGLIRD